MATETTNLHLKKPATGETILVSDLNDNYDTIDAAVHTAQTGVEAADKKASILYKNSHHTAISSGDNLNNYNLPGVYVCSQDSITQSLLNTPAGIYGNFKLLVNVNTGDETGGGSWWGMQIILCGFNLYYRAHVDSTWEAWRRIRYDGDESEKIVYATLTNVTIPDGATTSQEIDLDLTDYIPSGYSLWSVNVLMHSGNIDYALPWYNHAMDNGIRVNRIFQKHVYIRNDSDGWGTVTIYLTLFLRK